MSCAKRYWTNISGPKFKKYKIEYTDCKAVKFEDKTFRDVKKENNSN